METRKVLASLCYFSIFFAGILLPIIVYFVSDDYWVKKHAKSAFLSHLLPYAVLLTVPFFLFASWSGNVAVGGLFAFAVLFAVLGLIIVAWNIYRGIAVLVGDGGGGGGRPL